MAEESKKDKPGIGERLHNAYTAAQVFVAVAGTPPVPVQQQHLSPPPTPPSIVRRVDQGASSPAAQVAEPVKQASDHIEHVNRQQRSRGLEHGEQESRPVAAQHPPKARAPRDGRPGPERSRSRER